MSWKGEAAVIILDVKHGEAFESFLFKTLTVSESLGVL